jgi:hypothetical protein
MGLQRASFDVAERLEEPTGRCSLPESSMVTFPISCKHPDVPSWPCSPSATCWRVITDISICRSIDFGHIARDAINMSE